MAEEDKRHRLVMPNQGEKEDAPTRGETSSRSKRGETAVCGGQVGERKVRDAATRAFAGWAHAKGEREREIRPSPPEKSRRYMGFWDGLDLEKEEEQAQS